MFQDSKKVRVLTILGTRPEIIRLSELIKILDTNFNHRVFFTSQNREAFVGSNFFTELEIRQPDVILGNTSNSTGEFLSLLFTQIERELVANRPDLVVILGDTNTALATIIVRKLGIPIYHLEAGNRSFDPNVPEEVNRKIVDHTADFNLAYSGHARANLLAEGLNSRNSIVIGTPLREVIEKSSEKIENSRILEELALQKGKYFLVSAHRQENIDNASRFAMLIEMLNKVAINYGMPIVVSTHPRLKSKFEKQNFVLNELINCVNPLGFIDYCKLQLNSRAVLSDSGSISEESAVLNFPAITIRDSMERPEAMESGSVLMSGLDPERVIAAIEYLGTKPQSQSVPSDYLIANTSERVVNFILSTYHVRDFWSGIRKSSF